MRRSEELTKSRFSANDIGPFKAIEESMLAHLTPVSSRSDVFSWYTLIGMIGQALGTLLSGWVIEKLQSRDGWTTTRAYRIIFFGYGVIGVIKSVLSLMLSRACEIDTESDKSMHQPSASAPPSERSRLLPDDGKKTNPRNGWRAPFSAKKESLIILGKINFLLALESIAAGLLVT